MHNWTRHTKNSLCARKFRAYVTLWHPLRSVAEDRVAYCLLSSRLYPSDGDTILQAAVRRTSHCGGLGSAPGQSMWVFWWTAWHPDTSLKFLWFFHVTVTPLHIYSCIVWGLDSGAVSGRSSNYIYFHPFTTKAVTGAFQIAAQVVNTGSCEVRRSRRP
jgi:hypothetical protein